MDPDVRERLEGHMAAMAAEGPAMVLDFLDDFGDTLAGVVRGHLRDLHRGDLVADADEVRGLVYDVGFELADRARSWDPAGGALPWTWAHRAVRSCIVRAIGHALADIEIDDLDPGVGRDGRDGTTSSGPGGGFDGFGPLGSGTDDLDGLARRYPDVALLVAAIGEALGAGPTSGRNREVYVEYRLQRRLGDPSPAETLADRTGLGPENIRQIHSRTHRKVRYLVETDDRYRPLRDTGWMAA